MDREQAFDRCCLDLYDKHAHDFVNRREFLGRLTAFTASSAPALAIFNALRPGRSGARPGTEQWNFFAKIWSDTMPNWQGHGWRAPETGSHQNP